MINVFIPGSNTPFVRLAMPRVVRLVMPRTTGHVVLAIVWGAALAGVALTLLPPSGRPYSNPVEPGRLDVAGLRCQ